MSFLASVAAHLYEQLGKDLADTAIIFPNKRPAIYFRQHLGNLITTPMWSPDLFTIHEFIQTSTQALSADRLLCSSILYEAYQEVLLAEGSTVVSYERFFPLGEILLNDFNELESNAVSIKDLYSNLAELASIDQGLDYLTEEQLVFLQNFWKNFSVQKLSQQKERFLQLWKNLPAVFNSFHEKLQVRGLTTTGMIYRNLVTGSYDNPDFLNRWKKLVFVGFNALNRSELQVLQRWQEQGIALFYFDTDHHYMDDSLQEAGRFLRRNAQLFTNQLEMGNTIRDKTTPIQLVAAEGHAAQVRLLPTLLQAIPGILEEPEQTAILLADENQLLPVLHALPDWIKDVNITMGYSLHQSPVFSLVQTLIRLQESFIQQKGRAVYFQPLLQLLQHPYFYQLPEAEKLVQQLQQKSLVQIERETWTSLTDPRLLKALEPIASPLQLLDIIREVLEQQALAPTTNTLASLETQVLTTAYQQLNRLKDLLSAMHQEISLSFVGETLLQVLRTQSVPLEGEPLKGLQIMGLLESRALDFKHIILLNVNEGVLPKKAAAPTFIPDSIRRAYGLSVLENQDAIFAYVFYRLLQRSSSFCCTYNTTVDEKGMAEPSRFLTQLEYETSIPFIRKTVKLPVAPEAKEAITIFKDEGVMRTLRKYRNENSVLSPSAINTYLECRLRFYFRHVQGIKEPDEIEEEIDARVLGNILHRAIEFIYRALAQQKGNNLVEASDGDWLKSQVDHYIQEALGHELANDRKQQVTYTGTLRVVEEVIRTYVHEILLQDLQYAPFQLLEQELKLMQDFSVSVSGEPWIIKMGGYIDRIDFKDGVYRIIDYKTGGDKKELKSIEQLFERDRADRNKAALQTILYTALLKQKMESTPGWLGNKSAQVRVNAGLYDVRNMRKTGNSFNWRFEDTAQKQPLDEINMQNWTTGTMEKLKEVVAEILDPNQPYDQTTRVQKCEYCAYKKICGR